MTEHQTFQHYNSMKNGRESSYETMSYWSSDGPDDIDNKSFVDAFWSDYVKPTENDVLFPLDGTLTDHGGNIPYGKDVETSRGYCNEQWPCNLDPNNNSEMSFVINNCPPALLVVGPSTHDEPEAENVQPTEKDVVFTHGGTLTDHPSNIPYDKDVKTWRGYYMAISIDNKLPQKTLIRNKDHRAKVSMTIVDVVQSEGGRFLQEGPQGRWYILDYNDACQKTSQVLGGNKEDLIPKSVTRTLPCMVSDHEVAHMPTCQLPEDTAMVERQEEAKPHGASLPEETSVPTGTVKTGAKMKQPQQRRPKKRKVTEPISEDVVPKDEDVLFGRGAMTNHHPGNKLYRGEIDRLRPQFQAIPDENGNKKTSMSWEVVHFVHNLKGRFLDKDDEGKWYVVDDNEARKKAIQALREKKTEAL